MALKLTSAVKLIDGMHFQGINPGGHIVEMDSAAAGVTTAGSTPMEIILQAAGGCSGMDVVFILRKRKRDPQQFEIELEGIKKDKHPRLYREINVVYRAKGEGITVAELERAAALSMKTYCAVFGMLSKAAEVNWRCEIIE